MVLILGKTGYVSRRFQDFFNFKGIEHRAASISTRTPDAIETIIQALKPKLVINCMGYTGSPNVDACEDNKEECLFVNVILAQKVAEICKKYDIVLGHVSSGCIYQSQYEKSGYWIFDEEEYEKSNFCYISQFDESDPPNFSFLQQNCSFYSGTKALGEDVVRKTWDKHYLWRLRMPFNHLDSPKNYLSKIFKYPNVWSIENSLTNVDEFVRTCYYSWVKDVPHGTYNIVNPDALSAKEIIELAQEISFPYVKGQYNFITDEEEFSKLIRAPRSNCVLNPHKILYQGFGLLPALESVKKSLKSWNNRDATIFW